MQQPQNQQKFNHASSYYQQLEDLAFLNEIIYSQSGGGQTQESHDDYKSKAKIDKLAAQRHTRSTKSKFGQESSYGAAKVPEKSVVEEEEEDDDDDQELAGVCDKVRNLSRNNNNQTLQRDLLDDNNQMSQQHVEAVQPQAVDSQQMSLNDEQLLQLHERIQEQYDNIKKREN